jgi:hypothetical protein
MSKVDPTRLVKIGKEDLYYAKKDFYFQRPTFQDYSHVWKLYPSATRENPEGPGYQFEEFLAAYCLRNANGTEPDAAPADAITRFDELDNVDRQALVNIFTSAFLLDQQGQDEAEMLAEELLASDRTGLEFTLVPENLPLQSCTLTFRRLSSAVKMHVDRTYSSEKINGCQYPDLLMLTCLSHVNGKAVENPRNVLPLVYDYELIDIQFAVSVFTRMFFLDDSGRQKAKSLGKNLRAALLSQPQSTSPSAAPASPTTSAVKSKEAVAL